MQKKDRADSESKTIAVGAAKIDITPGYPILLNGYAVREEECAGIEQRLQAGALAFGGDGDGLALLLTVENTGVPAPVTEAVFNRLSGRFPLARENFALCSTHTHHSPMLTGVLPNLFSREIDATNLARIDRYTLELVDLLERVGCAAFDDRRPAFVGWGKGRVGFARNRRTEGGPVDHSLPVLSVSEPDGKLRAVFARYACHCTTLDRRSLNIHGDWAGEAREAIEQTHPGAIAMIGIGCAGDAGPRPKGTPELARQYGAGVAAEVERLLGAGLHPLGANPRGRFLRLSLPFDPLPSRRTWAARAREGGIVAYHARRNLERIDRKDTLPETLPYSVQAWLFGEELGMLFLPGEVVVDYTLRIEKDFDPERIWINAYANDVPCYIPSRRILEEGGYEAETSLWYYDCPARLAPETEDLIIDAIHQVLPEFRRLKATPAEVTK